jgi:hypothetical protein
MRKARMGVVLVAVLLSAALVGCGASTPSGQQSTTVQGADTTTSATTASVQPPAGWTKFTGDHAEIYLSPSYDLNLLDVVTRENIVAQGAEGADFVRAFESQVPTFSICVVSSSTDVPGFTAKALVSKDQAPEGITFALKEIVDEMLATQPSGARVTSRTDNLRLGGLEAAQLTIDHAATQVTNVMYFVKDQSDIWTIVFAAPTTELGTWLPDIETSAATFRVTP